MLLFLHEHHSSTLFKQTSLMCIQTAGLDGIARKCLPLFPFLCIFLNSLWPTMPFSGDISLPPLYLGVIVWIRRDCIYSDSRGANWQGNKWPDNQHHSDPSQRRNKSKKKKNHYLLQTGLSHDVTCDKEGHILETWGGRGWDRRKEGTMKIMMRKWKGSGKVPGIIFICFTDWAIFSVVLENRAQ